MASCAGLNLSPQEQLLVSKVAQAAHCTQQEAVQALVATNGDSNSAINHCALHLAKQFYLEVSLQQASGSGGWLQLDDFMTWHIAKATTQHLTITRHGFIYDIDLVNLWQKNQQSGKLRQLRRTVSPIPLTVTNASIAPSPPPNPLSASRGSGGLFGVSGGLFSSNRRRPQSTGSLFREGEGCGCHHRPELALDFSDVRDQDDPITKWWDSKAAPVASSKTSYQYAAVSVEKGGEEWNMVAGCCGNHQLLAVFRVQNSRLIKRFRSYGEQLRADVEEDGGHASRVHIQTVVHGTSTTENLNNIAHSGFDVIYSASEGSINAWGNGVYFGTSPAVSDLYMCNTPKELQMVGVPAEGRVAFLAALATADMSLGSKGEIKPSFIEGSKSGRRYDTFCNRLDSPTIVVATDNAQAYPAYMLCFG